MTQAPVQPIRVLVSHSDPLMQVGLTAAVAEHADFALLQLADRRLLSDMQSAHFASVDVVISDYSISMSMLSARRSRCHRDDDPAVVVVAIDVREMEVREAMSRGVRGYLTLDCTADELAAAVRCAHRGKRYLCEHASEVAALSFTSDRLTPREREVLLLLVEGCSNKSMARRLDVSVGTVKSHMSNILSKLHVKSRTQAAVAAERRGLIARERGLPQPNEREAHSDVAVHATGANLQGRLSRSDWPQPASEAA